MILWIFLVCLCFIGSSSTAFANEYIKWTSVPTNKSTALNSIVYGKGTFVAVGERGVIETSADGQSWTEQHNPVKDDLKKVIFNGSTFVAIGDTKIIRSSDGISWADSKVVVNEVYVIEPWEIRFADIVWNGEKFVAVGKGIIAYSADGSTWYSAPGIFLNIWHLGGGVNLGDTLEQVSWNGKHFVACGRSGGWVAEPDVYVSDDGVKWIKIRSNEYAKYLLADKTGRFIKATNQAVYSSPDGSKWSMEKSSWENLAFLSIRDIGNKFFGVSGSVVYSSGDGIKWNAFSQKDDRNIRDIAWNGRDYFCVGGNHNIQKLNADGTWENINKETVFNLNSVATNGKLVVAVGDQGQILTSSDGLSWSRGRSGTSLNLTSVVWHGGKFVIVGDGGTILSSSDGVKWATVKTGIAIGFSKVIWGGGHFVTVGELNTIMVSKNGLNWQKVLGSKESYGNTKLWDVAFNGKQYVAVTEGYDYFTSSDGINWKHGLLSSSGEVIWGGNNIVWDGKKYIIASSDRVFLSKDGMQWQIYQFDGISVTKVYVGTNFYIAAGPGGNISISKDGLLWMPCAPNNNPFEIKALVSFKNRYVVVGEKGAIFNGTVLKYPVQTALITTYINGELHYTDKGELDFLKPQPIIVDNNLLLSAQNLARAIHADYKYDKNSTILVLSKNGYTMKYVIKLKQAFKNGKKVKIKIYPRLVSGVPFVNIKEVAETFEYTYKYGDLTKRIYLDHYYKAGKSNLIWKNANIPAIARDSYFVSVAYGKNIYVVVTDDGKILYSNDCFSWLLAVNKPEYSLADVKWDGQRFMAVGRQTSDETAVVMMSEDGMSWTDQNITSLPALSRIAFNGKLIVAGGGKGTIATSTDGINWTQQFASGADLILGIAWNGKTFAATDNKGFVYLSADGTKWSKIRREFNYLNSIYYINGLFWMIGDWAAYNSADGVNWNNVLVDEQVLFLVYSDKTYLFYANPAGTGFFMASKDGKRWDRIVAPSCLASNGIWDGKRYILVGDNVITVGTQK